MVTPPYLVRVFVWANAAVAAPGYRYKSSFASLTVGFLLLSLSRITITGGAEPEDVAQEPTQEVRQGFHVTIRGCSGLLRALTKVFLKMRI